MVQSSPPLVHLVFIVTFRIFRIINLSFQTEPGKRKHRAYALLSYFLSARFSLVLFVLAVAEGILWAYPMYHPRGIGSDPLNREETADLQDYFQSNLDCFKNTCHQEPEATQLAEQRVVKSSQREFEADFQEKLNVKAQQQVKRPQQEPTTGLIKIALLLLLGAAGLQSSGSSTDEGIED